MTDKGPTYRERAIATAVSNVSAMRDLIIDLASEIDKLVSVALPPSDSEDGNNNQKPENEAT